MTKSNEFVGVDDKFIPESEKEKMKKADIEAESRQKKVTKFYVGYLVVGAIIFIAFIVFIIMMFVNISKQQNEAVEMIENGGTERQDEMLEEFNEKVDEMNDKVDEMREDEKSNQEEMQQENDEVVESMQKEYDEEAKKMKEEYDKKAKEMQGR